MSSQPETLTPEKVSGIVNGLRAAASRWREWSEELALPEVAEIFARQAAEADASADMFSRAQSVVVWTAPE